MNQFRIKSLLLGFILSTALAGTSLSSTLFPAQLNAYLCPTGVNLKWTLNPESLKSTVVLERSLNGKDFVEISRVEKSSMDGITKEFLETDFDLSPGMRYYRLKCTDTEGRESISESIAILKKAGKPELFDSVVLHQDESKWNTDQNPGEEVVALVLDTEGNELISKFRFIQENDKIYAADLLHEIPPGSYTISACSKQRYYSAQLNVK